MACELVYSEKDPQLSIGATCGITFWKELRKVSTQPVRACDWRYFRVDSEVRFLSSLPCQ